MPSLVMVLSSVSLLRRPITLLGDFCRRKAKSISVCFARSCLRSITTDLCSRIIASNSKTECIVGFCLSRLTVREDIALSAATRRSCGATELPRFDLRRSALMTHEASSTLSIGSETTFLGEEDFI
jgi:hypothetical protein